MSKKKITKKPEINIIRRRVVKQEIPYDIPPEGSLGLLALGSAGLEAWRKKRTAADIDRHIVIQYIQEDKKEKKDGEPAKEESRPSAEETKPSAKEAQPSGEEG